jgi:signal transduction histidine kinase
VGRINAVSPTFASRVGRSATACIGAKITTLVHRADRDCLQMALSHVAAHGGETSSAPICVRLLNSTGSEASVDVLLRNGMDDAELLGILVTLRSANTATATAGRRVDARARLDVELWGSEVGFWEMDVPRNRTRWVGPWCQLHDVDPCDGPNHVARWDTRIHADDLHCAKSAFDATLAGEREYYEAEYRVATGAGSWSWIRERGRVTERSEDGTPLRMIGICVDINSLRRAEEALESAEERLDLALEAAQIPVWEWDLPRGSVRIDQRHGSSLTVDRLSSVHPDDRTRLMDAVAKNVLSRESLFECEYRKPTPDGGWKWALDRGRVVAFDADGAPLVARGVTIDIDERKQLESTILDAVNREQQRLGRDLHDGLSQELTGAALLLRASLKLLERDRHPSADGVREAIDVVNEAIETSRRVAHGLSALTTLRGGLEDALAHLARGYKDRSGIRVRFSKRCHTSVRLDQIQIEHLFRIAQEAVTNALRHARASTIEVHLAVNADTICLSVSDNGAGIDLERIGGGLGTRIMAFRAGVLGGRIRIHRRAPRGTRVECLCPNPPVGTAACLPGSMGIGADRTPRFGS